MRADSRGVALLEIVVALGLFGVGMLGLASTISAAQRLEMLVSQRTRVTVALAAQLDRLRASVVTGCPAATGQVVDTAHPAITFDWSVSPAGSVAWVWVGARISLGRDSLRDSLSTALPCG